MILNYLISVRRGDNSPCTRPLTLRWNSEENNSLLIFLFPFSFFLFYFIFSLYEGLRVNWKSYGHDRQPRLQQAQPEASHYAEPSAQRAPPPPQHRPPIQQQQQQQQQPSYRPYNDAPAQIKQLLQFQAQIPYVNAIPEQFR